MADAKSDKQDFIAYLEKGGLEGVPFYLSLQLDIAKATDPDIRYWLILAYIIGCSRIGKDVNKAKELLLAKETPKSARFDFLSGLLYLQKGAPYSPSRALICFTRACVEPSREHWYYLGECQLAHALELNVTEDHRHSSDPQKTKAFSLYQEWLSNAYASFYNAYEMGSLEALLGMGKCEDAANPLRCWPAMNAAVHRSIDDGLTLNYLCCEKAAKMGLAEGYQKATDRMHYCPRMIEDPFETLQTVTYKQLLELWNREHNIAVAYWMSRHYNQEDALPHYVSGVVYECGLMGFAQDGARAKEEFELAANAKLDESGFVRDLAQEHLIHICSLKGYDKNFYDFSYRSNRPPREALLYLEYMAEYGNDSWSVGHDSDKRRFSWWYRLRLAQHLKNAPKRQGELLVATHSPDAICMMAEISDDLYSNPLLTSIDPRFRNKMLWYKVAQNMGSGCPVAEYKLATCYMMEKAKAESKKYFVNYLEWYKKSEPTFDKLIIEQLKKAARWGLMEAEFELLYAMRYGNIQTEVMRPEEIAIGFKTLKEKGHEKAKFEFAFCEYEQFGVSEKGGDFSRVIYEAACDDYGCARAIHEKLSGFTYWDDYDRGCQEI